MAVEASGMTGAGGELSGSEFGAPAAANRLTMGFAATCPGLCEADASACNSPPKTPVRRQRAATSICLADGTRPAENDSRRIAPSLGAAHR